jgi:ribosomal protein S18 acetylase RimI-like enzyme
MDYKLLTQYTGPDLSHSNEAIADFLFQHLDEYGDSKDDILKALHYVFDRNTPGGKILLQLENDKIVAATVINHTGMEGYIPENILVYIAVHKKQRGRGLGKQLLQNAIKLTKGDLALHVEENNPALHLYETMGFENKYLEMRLQRTS